MFIGGAGTTGNSILGNFIGTNAAGDDLSHVRDGIALGIGASGNTLRGNVIGFSGRAGILLFSNGTTGNAVVGNFVGTNAQGDNLANPGVGVGIISGAAGNVIGGTAPGEGNTIGFNLGSGVLVAGQASVGNVILGNAIFDNAALGLDLSPEGGVVADGVTMNDGCGDADTGPNGFQNFPVLVSAVVAGSNTTIDFDLDTAAGDYRVEFFSVLAADPTGHGEGRTFLGAEQVSVSATCDESFEVELPVGAPEGALVTATATPLDGGQPSGFGGTSEFAAAVLAQIIDGIFGDRFQSDGD